MKVIAASGDTPMATAAQIHEELRWSPGRGVRQCCEEHARADAELGVQRVMERLQKQKEVLMVRAKFTVVERTEFAGGQGGKTQERVTLSAVYGPGNESWSRWTPSGKIEMTITNEAALDQFPVGAQMYVDFSPVPEVVAAAPEADSAAPVGAGG